jgi:hypothetical protein
MKKALVLLMVGVMSTAAFGVQMFDFDDLDNVMTAPGYTSVTRTSLYTTAAGYGLVPWPGADPLSDTHQSNWVVGGDDRLTDAVFTNNWGDYFRVDVQPGQDYEINFWAGVPGWSCWAQAVIQGTLYSFNQNPAGPDSGASHPGHMKVWDAYNGPRVRDLVSTNSGADPLTTTAGEIRYGSYDNIRMFGYNNQSEYYGKGWTYDDEHRSEFLYVEGVVVTSDQLLYDDVNDKYWIKVETYPGDSYGVGFVALEVIPEPVTAVLLLGGVAGLVRRRRKG